MEYYKNSTSVGLNISAFSIGERKLSKTDFLPLKFRILTEAPVLEVAGPLCSRILKLAFELETAVLLVTNLIFSVGIWAPEYYRFYCELLHQSQEGHLLKHVVSVGFCFPCESRDSCYCLH